MERHLDQDLDRIRQLLLRMGAIVEDMIGDSLQALFERDSNRAQGVIERDRQVDELEKQLDQACGAILATHQPAAVDLRFLVAVMRINVDLERMGDAAVSISRSVLDLNQEAQLKPYIDLPRLDELVRKMVRDALTSFVERSVELAVAVCRADSRVDDLYRQLFRELLSYMIEDPKTTTRGLHLLLVARSLERIADHATNIAEDVVFYVEGRDIRHLDDDEPL